MRIVGYTRERPVASGAESAFGQGERIRRFASDHGHLVVATCHDAHDPGTDRRRHGFRSALAVIGAGEAEALLVADLEVLAEDVVSQEVLIHRTRTAGAEVLSCDAADEKQLTDHPADPDRRRIRATFRVIGEVEATLDG